MADTRAGSIKFRKPRNRLPIRLLALVACVSVVCVVVFLGPKVGLSIPLSCDIRKTSSNPESPSSEPICAIINDKSTQEDVDPSVNGSQEATDVTAPGDTLISVLTDNLSDERSIKEIAQSLAAAIQTSLSAPFTSETVLPAGRRYSITIDSEGRFLQAVLEAGARACFPRGSGRWRFSVLERRSCTRLQNRSGLF